VNYVLSSYISSSGGDIYIDSGTFNISSGGNYSYVDLSLFGMTGAQGGSVDSDDIDSYPILVSTGTATHVFLAYSECTITARYITFYYSEPAYDLQ
jgi:hypothetical protein